MSQKSSLQIIIPDEFTQAHHDALMTCITASRSLNTAVWRQLYQGIGVLDKAQLVIANQTQTFRQVYDEFIGRPLADQYIEQLLETKNVLAESPKITAIFARQIIPILQKGFLRRDDPYSVILQAYCLYWWQSFARGYAFEVIIMRDLIASGIDIQMHDIQSRTQLWPWSEPFI